LSKPEKITTHPVYLHLKMERVIKSGVALFKPREAHFTFQT
jgi:hypothetical protein